MIYAYSQPYHSTPINLFEFLTIVDILLMLMISTNSQFKVIIIDTIVYIHIIKES